MRKPAFFISSTIFDFRDLRGAIKYQLELQGNLVLASEFNDFRKPLDLNSYEACLASIELCDYFILLIGSRVGGWYDETNRISITQQEYRRAYELHKAGRLKLITFIRSEVWQAKESQKALAKHLETLDLSEEIKHRIVGHPSKFVSDAAFIINFVEEVGRNQETRAAVSMGGSLPTGNWIHIIDDFRDVMDVLRTLLFGGLSIEEAAYRKVLQHELVAILKSTLLKMKGNVYSPKAAVETFAKAYPIHPAARTGAAIKVATKDWDKLCSVMVHLLGTQLNTIVLQDALISPMFVEFDAKSDAYRESLAYSLIARLVDEIHHLNRTNIADTLSIIFPDIPRRRSPNTSELHLDAMKLAQLIFLGYRWANTVDLAVTLLRVLNGGTAKFPTLLPFSPISGMDQEIGNERVTAEEVWGFLSA